MPQTKVKEKLPRWDLANIYSGLDAPDLTVAIEKVVGQLDALDAFIQENGIGKLPEIPEDVTATAQSIEELLKRFNETHELLRTLVAFVYGYVTTDSYDKLAARRHQHHDQRHECMPLVP